MKIVCDECCPSYVVTALRQDGLDVIYVAENTPSQSDQDILSWALTEERIIVTEDRDFCELVFLNKKLTYGIVLVRIHPLKRQEKVERLRELFKKHGNDLRHAMTTLTLTNVRVRPLAPPN